MGINLTPFELELKNNILPFWMRHTVDREKGGFYGALTNDLRIVDNVDRSCVTCARILWTFSAAYRVYGKVSYLNMAKWAYAYLTNSFWDRRYGGVYWTLNRHGSPVNDRKHLYAQAFAIYGLSEYYRAATEQESLDFAQELYRLVQEYTFDSVNKGYIECCSRKWGTMSDMRLTPFSIYYAKSTNSMLHLLEAYGNLMRVWRDTELNTDLKELIRVFFDRVIDSHNWHLKKYFDEQWNSLANGISYGHDIEFSWLLVDSAEVLGDAQILRNARDVAVKIAYAVLAEAVGSDGSLINDWNSHHSFLARLQNQKLHWVQAEAVVGFYNAYQISKQSEFAQAAANCWNYIRKKLIDRVHGDWFKVANRLGIQSKNNYKAGPWECPYHHSRMCLEMIERLTKHSTIK